MVSFKILRTKHNGKENRNFNLVRQNGTDDYLFLHFKTPVIFTLFDKVHRIAQGTCIILSPNTPHAFHPENCELVHDWIHFLPSDKNVFADLKIELNTFFSPSNPDFITASVKRCELEHINKNEFFERY